ncbi:hypothetical protein [Microbacterium sp. IEGM 1404]|uniref:hypothetical protein n=1 Tax=Microbacterium sp. IEGM 1404 TaxID=3047084 RepID=UPI0024B7E604|nr:hypothetical protein [Microbacterium sp. IEGM 1404]MDI9889931.1 hypothetical protein [Microbacterium sp. IEGM 1404]
MTRVIAALAVIGVAALTAPIAAADPALNSADFIVAASPLLFVGVCLAPRRRLPREPWFADVDETHPDALGSLDTERITHADADRAPRPATEHPR